MNILQTQQWSEETDRLLGRAREALRGSGSRAVREMASQLPETGPGDESPIRVAFAGQYSSGKSTLIRALTGREDIATGAGITTDQAQDYEWNGLLVTDTPGIHTGVRPEHDRASYDAISRADLLVFVITNELFDEHMGQHYRKLTIDHDKAHETVVVVNKMDRHALGNSPDSRAVLTEALREPLQPFSPEEMRLTFTDARSTLDAAVETDPEIAEMLLEQGNVSALVENLNSLVRDKGLTGRHTTKLYRIQQVLGQALEVEESGDPQADALLLVYNQNIRAIAQVSAEIRGEIRLAILKANERIRRAAEEVNEILDRGRGEAGSRSATETGQERIKEAVEELDESVTAAMREALPELQNRIETMQQGGLHRDAVLNLGKREEGANWMRVLGIIQRCAGRAGETAAGLARNQAAVRVGMTGLRQFSGSAGHTAILSIGRTFGYSFQPWQAVRLTQTIGRAAGAIGIAMAVVGIAMDIKEERDQRRREQAMLEERQNVRAEFGGVAQAVEREARASTDAAIRELLDDPLAEITKARDELNLARQARNHNLERLNSTSAAVSDPIMRIHSGESSGSINAGTAAG